MKFEEWFSEAYRDHNLKEESGWYAKYGWEACKKEILKVLEQNKIQYSNSSMFEEIKEL